ncbi:MAG: hypothetical protein SFU98_23080 [Leptospiraceae bacterium]|nr:hypothetical protein [Leptospiraceae bacterium]
MSIAIKSGIFFGLTSLVSLLLLIYVEDYLIHGPLSKFPECKISIEVYTGRLMLAVSISVFNALATYIFVSRFYKEINLFGKQILDWGRGNLAEIFLVEKSNYVEINELKQIFQNSIHANKEKEERVFRRILWENNEIFKEQILTNTIHLRREPLRDFEIAAIPANSNHPDIDYFNILETKNGLLCFVCGFEKSDILTASMKSRLKTTIDFLSKVSIELGEESILLGIIHLLNELKFDKLNVSAIHLSRDSEKLYFFHYGKNPIYIISDTIKELPATGEVHYPNLDFPIDIKSYSLSDSEILFFLSDRIRSKRGFDSDEFLENLKTEISEKRESIQNAKDLLILSRKNLENFERQIGTDVSFIDSVCLFSVRKKS